MMLNAGFGGNRQRRDSETNTHFHTECVWSNSFANVWEKDILPFRFGGVCAVVDQVVENVVGFQFSHRRYGCTYFPMQSSRAR